MVSRNPRLQFHSAYLSGTRQSAAQPDAALDHDAAGHKCNEKCTSQECLRPDLHDRGVQQIPKSPDVFDPAMVSSIQNQASTIQGFEDSPWVIAAFVDQTDDMRGVNDYQPHLGFVTAATNFEMKSDPHAFRGAQANLISTLRRQPTLPNHDRKFVNCR